MNLIICITPLQVLIAKRIIETNQINNSQSAFIGLYLPYGDNPKHHHYYQQLAKVCQQSAFIELKNQTWGERFATLNRLKTTLQQFGIWQQPIEGAYLASLDVLFLQYVISKVKFSKLYTFDDGTANIFPNSTYFNPLPKSLPMRLFKKLVGIRYPDIPSILAKTARHYTIFPHEKNLVENIQVIELLTQNSENTAVETNQVKRLILGQAIDNFVGETVYHEVVDKLIRDYQTEYFCPHPRENLDFSDKMTVIHSEKIIEDYLSDELTANPHCRYELYTFMSTAVFTLRDFPRVDIFIVYNQPLYQRFSEAYEFLAEKGFTMIDLDNESLPSPPFTKGGG
ncbi:MULTISPECIES: glycosyltransferase family 52 [unclassified Moraxella]|uniref:glycosyltransferase family 52 n=1 Tax=unclassified Moraxella TaxID=2685852 RepID=UPI003AF42A8F